jgi:sulfur relay protein TusB/DsrH
MLHLVSSKNNVQQLLKFVVEGDAVLFMENSTFGLLKKSAFVTALTECVDKVDFYTLLSDIQLRGIIEDELTDMVNIVDYSEFVALTIKYQVIKTWN